MTYQELCAELKKEVGGLDIRYVRSSFGHSMTLYTPLAWSGITSTAEEPWPGDGEEKARCDVNWSAIGSVSPASARDYAAVILAAAKAADWLLENLKNRSQIEA